MASEEESRTVSLKPSLSQSPVWGAKTARDRNRTRGLRARTEVSLKWRSGEWSLRGTWTCKIPAGSYFDCFWALMSVRSLSLIHMLKEKDRFVLSTCISVFEETVTKLGLLFCFDRTFSGWPAIEYFLKRGRTEQVSAVHGQQAAAGAGGTADSLCWSSEAALAQATGELRCLKGTDELGGGF